MVKWVIALLAFFLVLGLIVGQLGFSETQAILVLAVPLVLGTIWLLRAQLRGSSRR